MLWFLAFFGIVVFIYGFIKSSGKIEGTSSIAVIFDHELTIAYAFLVSIWSTFFLEFWKRKNARLAYRWSVTEIERDELPRPDWIANSFRKSPVTGKLERFYPKTKKRVKLLISVAVVFVCITIVSISVGALMLFKAWTAKEYTGSRAWQGSVATGVLSLVTMLLMNQAYSGVAEKLTQFENHRTESEYESTNILFL